MKVLTLNIHAWLESHPREKMKEIVNKISKEQYDVIALQEVNQPLDGKTIEANNFVASMNQKVDIKENNFAHEMVQQLRRIGEEYSWSWIASHIGYDQYDEGVAILSKHPIKKAESIHVSTYTAYDNFRTRKQLKVTIDILGEAWDIFSCHFSWWKNDKGENAFKQEWDTFLPYVNREKNVLLMGDFNNEATIVGEGYDYIRETAPYIRDTFNNAEKIEGEHTVISEIDGWKGDGNKKRIDYIFTNQKVEIEKYKVVFDGENSPVVSDHFGIEVTMNF